MALCWRADDGPTLDARLVALYFLRGSGPVLLRNPTFCKCPGGVINYFIYTIFKEVYTLIKEVWKNSEDAGKMVRML